MSPAPKKNEFWKLRSKHGRDKIFESPKIFLEAAYEYFEQCDKHPWNKMEVVKTGQNAGQLLPVPTQKPYTIQGLCIFTHITLQTWINYQTSESHKDFFDIFTHVRDIIENNQFEGATVGAYDSRIIARKLGLVDKTENRNFTIESHVVVQDEETSIELEKLIDKFDKE